MKASFTSTAAAGVTLIILTLTCFAFVNPTAKPVKPKAAPKIQAAILLDVSNSMDGLIEQAKAQLWNMVSVMGKAKCPGNTAPQIEIALYEYGRDSNPVKDGYVKQVSPFTTDLDKLSQELFKLTTNGGEEYCGQVIFTSLNELKWDAAPSNYKVIFIAGNEDFLQGNLSYTKACAEARKKGVTVNTIYCGDRMQGIREHWNLNAECGSGSFTNINADAKIEDIPTPYDSTLFVLNDKLNSTYISYGQSGSLKFMAQAEVDKKNYAMNRSAAVQRVTVKGQKNLYRNGSWDLVDADGSADTKDIVAKVDMKTLPDSLQNKTRAQLKEIVTQKAAERTAVQKEIETVNIRREAYIAAERKKKAENKNTPTLQSEIEKVITLQARRYNMQIQ